MRQQEERGNMKTKLMFGAAAIALMAAAPVGFNATTGRLDLNVAVAKHGADDPPGDDRGNHGAGHASKASTQTFAKHGADDPPGDDRGNHGAGHASKASTQTFAKHGADDPPGDDRGNHGPGHA
jgi:hypothetical protein